MNVEHSMSDAVGESSPTGENGQPSPVQIVSPGAQLAACRQERGWTVEQVASQLNLAPRQIVAIESDDYPALPGMAIVRGFIRAYAKLLKVDPAPLLATLGGETVLSGENIAPRKTLATPFSDARLPVMTERSGLFSKWLFALLLLLLLGVAIWAAQRSGDIAEISRSASSQVKDGLAYLSPSNPTEKKSATPEGLPPTATVPATPDVPNVVAEAPPATQEALPAPAGVEEQANGLDTDLPAKSEAPTDKDNLLLTAAKDSWIEVRRISNNSVVTSGIVKAGTTESVVVSEPMSVVIGNADGVEARLRGVPLVLKNSARNNVARLTLK
jgi:cytoskeleton protein RodZ